MKAPYTILQINSFSRDEFSRIIGPVFEHSPWIAEMTWLKRPFTTFEALHHSLCRTLHEAGDEKQLKLIRGHPDLVGRAAMAGTVTPHSTREQASAGLDQLGPEEIAAFQKYNQAYQTRFGFPFIVCARLNKKEAILAGFEKRLANSREQEIKTPLEEIAKIARLR